jgi:transcriptional regulator with XRE-family HTH domain
MSMVTEYLPNALKTLRTRRRLRVDELAQRARLSERAIRNLEDGAIPKADTLAKLAAALRVDVRAFFA